MNSNRLWPFYSQECVEDVSRLISEGRTYSSGPDEIIFDFEKKFKTRFSTHNNCLFANSATAIVYAIYSFLAHESGFKKNKNIVVPAHTYRATVLPAFPLGLEIRFYNQVCPGSIDYREIAGLCDENTVGIVITHLFGLAINLDKLIGFSGQSGIPIIEDCSHAHGVSIDGNLVGSETLASVFSTGTKKLVSGGMGGVLMTSNSDLYDFSLEILLPPLMARAKSIRKNKFFGSGFNMRGTPITARLALDHVEKFDSIVHAKNKSILPIIKAINLNEGLDTPVQFANQSGTFYNIPFNVKGDISEFLEKTKNCNLRIKKYVEFLPSKAVFIKYNPHFKDIENHWDNLFYFDTRDLYEDNGRFLDYVGLLENHC